MATYNLTEKQILGPIPVTHGSLVRVTPSSGGSVTVEYTKDQESKVFNGTATYTSWPLGTASSQKEDIAKRDCYMRFTVSTGTASVIISENEQVPDQLDKDWLGFVNLITAKVIVNVPTTIPNSVSPVGDFTTILQFNTNSYDSHGGIVDVTNHRLNIIPGYSWCRVSYSLAWDLNATGWRGCRVKNSLGSNYGNVRFLSVGAGATTNIFFVSPWIQIATNSAPNSIASGSYFDFWPAQTSGGNLDCGADLASSWVAIEFI